MNIQELYDALDALEEDARSTAEDFANTGDLKALADRVNTIGDRSYAIWRGVTAVMQALKFEE